MNEPAAVMLSVHDITWRYSSRHSPILKNLSFSLPQGALCMILGANGAGKSTLLKLLAEKLSCQQGLVSRGGDIAFVPQRTTVSLAVSVYETVLVGRSAHVGLLRAPNHQDCRICEEALCRVGLQHMASREFSSLSGGEQQLVLMAQALASEARIILLDEVTAAMDWRNQAIILRLLQDLARQDYTISFITHSPQHALDFATHCLLMFPEGDSLFGSPSKIITDETMSRLYRLPVRCTVIEDRWVVVPQFIQKQGVSIP
ncbi:ABC transporter ATP-binding protein [Salmonella enterica]|uniref:ABC transporter ATP-binding protein n=1 Tax=Salmonella enterica I TaxID=59201 RepID=A0A615QZK9_SALET|nr:ABC transporter ATP-binding protein [Salmonella enterica]ECD3736508.1 ABC transporter ATP-binding protein [Salmonella enterica subsp. enterica serovar Stanley]ECW7869825.1 ABC transporter ATP-binding protein [Salmonella enterica subsp. enterica serovar Kingabwa]ECZ5203058.1 ABC transporter ATP-binding protein [Salmonella enterica subsp. enterica serovar Kentucky]EKI9898430.1 ABC transporter ATP-binding protein [Salmonella enterica subsp. enterica]